MFLEHDKQDKTFFIYFIDKDAKGVDIIAGVSSNGLVKFSGTETLNTPDLLEVLNHKYGSIKEFENYTFIDAQKHRIAQGIVKNFNNFTVKNNWQFYSQFFPEDKDGNLSLLISEIQLATGLSDASLTRIQISIQKDIQCGPHLIDFRINNQMIRDARYGYHRIIPFLGRDIYPTLSSALSLKQMDDYMIAYRINCGAAVRMRESLSARFNNNKSALIQFVTSSIIVTARRPLNYSLYNDKRNPVMITEL